MASVSVELVAVSLAILIPLAQINHLPDFHWKAVALGAPLKPVVVRPIEASSPGMTISRLFAPRIFVPSLVHSPLINGADDTGSASIEPPEITFVEGPSTVGIPLEKFAPPAVSVRPTQRPVSTPPAPTPSGPIRVSTGAQMAKLVRKVIPEYPPLAKSARVSGVVHLIGVIAKDGTIQNLQLISGHPLLARAAIEAVKQWVYLPTLLNGEPVEVIAPIDVNFTLNQ